MILTDLLQTLKASGIELTVRDGKLLCTAPKGTLTSELAAAVRAHKPALLDLLMHRAEVADDATGHIERLPPGGRRRLTTAQESLVFRQLLDPKSAFLNLPGAWHLHGQLDISHLQDAIRAFRERHEIVRTRIASDAQGSCFVTDDTPFEIPLIDLNDIDPAQREAHVVRYLEARSTEHVDLEQGPLFQCEILHVDTAHHVLFILVNHIVWDGWSFDIFLEEVDREYAARIRGEAAGLAPLPIQYGDYADWHCKWIGSPANRERIRKLANSLADYSQHFELPTDRVRPANFGYDGSSAYFELPEDVTARLQDRCKQYGVTPFMALLAIFKFVLYRFSGQTDIAVGSHIQNRTRAELDGLVGFFVNTMVIRTAIDPEGDFSGLLARVRESCLAAYDNRHVPIDLLVREMKVAPDPGNLPLVQVFFSYQDTSDRKRTIGDVRCQSVIRTAQTADADLTLWVRNFGDRLDGGFDFRTDLYEPETIGSLRSAFVYAVGEICRQPQTLLPDLRCVSDEEVAQQIDGWRGSNEPTTTAAVYELVRRQAEKTPGNSAISCRDRVVTYAQLDADVAARSKALLDAGIGRGSIVGVHVARSIDLVATLLSILRIGAVYLPLDPSLPDERLRLISEDARLALLVTDDRTRPAWLGDTATMIHSGTLANMEDVQAIVDVIVDPEDPAYMIYTSGSTGKPKGVVVKHSNVVNFLLAMAREPGIDETDRLLAVTTCSFDISVLEFFLPLCVGAEVVVATHDDTRDGNSLADLLEKRGITVLQSTPATWKLLLASRWKPESRLKALCGGEAMPVDLAKELLPRVHALFNMYGPTETTVWSTVHRFDAEPRDKVPLGRPIRNTRLYVLDRNRMPVPRGAIGELCIGGEGVTAGYHDRAELTAERFAALPFRPGERTYATGDLVRIGGSGELYFEGRIDHQVKVRGYRIELGDIENALQQVESVSEAVVVTKQLSADDHRLVAHVVPAKGSLLSVAKLRKELRRILPDYMIPQHIVEIAAMPLTPSGKIDRNALPDIELSASRRRLEPPATDAEQQVAAIWKEAIGVEAIDRRDHFFELGGHSLLAMHVIAEIEQRMGKRISAGALMLDSLQQIAASLASEGEVGGTFQQEVGVQKKGMLESIRGWVAQRAGGGL